MEIHHWQHGLRVDAQGKGYIDEERVKTLARQTLADPDATAAVLARMMRIRDPQGVYEEGGCIDATRERVRWVTPGHSDISLPDFPRPRRPVWPERQRASMPLQWAAARPPHFPFKPNPFSPFGHQPGQVALLGLRQPAQLGLIQVHLAQHLHRRVRRIARRIGARGALQGRAGRSASGRRRRVLDAIVAKAQDLHRDDRRLRLARGIARAVGLARPRPPPRPRPRWPS